VVVEKNWQEPKKITVSVIKADIGGWVGHSAIHPDLIQNAQEKLATAKTSGSLVDYHVTACGDDLQLIVPPRDGVDCEAIHRLAWETFEAGTREPRTSIFMERGRTSSPTPSAEMSEAKGPARPKWNSLNGNRNRS